jgi:hypothetical protein
MTSLNGQVPPLSKVFRPGAGRQRLAKGYIVEAHNASEVLSRLLAPGSRMQGRASEHGLTLRGSSHAPNALWIDSGLVWLHRRDAREKLGVALQSLVLEVSSALHDLGGRLLPSAVRLAGASAWNQLVCGDEHFVETSDQLEKAVFCNLVRFHLPELLALTGRAGAGRLGVERLGSRRMADSRRHVPARAFASLAPEYLPHLMKSLARDERVQHTSLLDIDPHIGDDLKPTPNDDCVELRFVDAQVHFRTSLSHALLFEALLIRARRIATEDKQIPGYPQPDFERDRARAIQHGLKARFAPRSLVDYPSSAMPNESDELSQGPVPAPARLLHLLDDLNFEFLALDARYRDLAPLVLGLKLRQWGNLSIQNENDLLQSKLAGESSESPEERIRGLLLSKHDPLTATNEAFEQARDIQADWITRLTLGGAG